MIRIRALLAVLAVALCVNAGLIGDDKKDEKPPVKAKGTLPANWSKLGLTDDQKKKVYTAQSEFREKIGELEAKIKELKKQEREEIEKVLTDAQKARLKEILLQKAPPDKKDAGKTTDKKDTTKPAEKKEPTEK